jgi:hypothetical protein
MSENLEHSLLNLKKIEQKANKQSSSLHKEKQKRPLERIDIQGSNLIKII